ncbi:Hypothetical predicted protein [Scomber scombrus]|uniref:Uncharacterized protein n=1 Tax=Scomber scombrus TaxID=13677 RepID=A0AAV1PIV2_SCOSC
MPPPSTVSEEEFSGTLDSRKDSNQSSCHSSFLLLLFLFLLLLPEFKVAVRLFPARLRFNPCRKMTRCIRETRCRPKSSSQTKQHLKSRASKRFGDVRRS